MKKCPMCLEPIGDDAKICPHCAENTDALQPPSQPPSQPSILPQLLFRLNIWGLFGTLLGGAIGVPVSYWFQPGLLRAKVSFPDYLSHLSEVCERSETFQPLVLAVVIFAVAGYAIGQVYGIKKRS